MRWRSIKAGMTGFSLAVLVFQFPVSAQEPVIAVEWGESMTCPDLGFNARILRQHAEENCGQPIQEDFRYDWNSANLRQDVRSIAPKILRFPGGTPSNFWNWYSETRQVMGEGGELVELEICEASLLGRSNSSAIGCSGNNLDMTAEWYDSIATKTTVTLESYLNAISYFRDQGMEVEELFVLNMIDPFYYLGSPHLEYLTVGASPEVVKDTLKNNVVNRVRKQLDKILLEKCGSCDTNDDEVHFELGNEFHLQRYGKYYPRLDCFDMIDDSLCISCFTDIEFYAEVCQEIVPEIRERFSNAKISMNASRDILHEDWNQVLLDYFNQGDEYQIDAAVYHYYPKTFHKDSLTWSRCTTAGNGYDADKSLHYIQAHMDRLTYQKNLAAFHDSGLDLWITEFNSYDYSEKCNESFSGWNDDDFVYDSADWIHALNVFTMMDRFLTYRSDMEDPWTNNALGLDIEKIAMHLFYGAEREAAFKEDREMTPAGMAMSTLISLMNDADSIQRLLIANESDIQIDGNGYWSTDIEEGEMLPIHHDLDYMDHTGSPAQMKTMDAHGWVFRSGEERKALIVNLRNEPLELNLDGMKSFNGDTRYTIHYVGAEEITTRIEHGWSTSFVHSESGETSAEVLQVPAYSVIILEDIPVMLPSGLSESHLNAFRVYPNPTEGEVQIQLITPSYSGTEVVLMDISGRTVLTEVIVDRLGSHLDLSSLNNGTYLLRLKNEHVEETVRICLNR